MPGFKIASDIVTTERDGYGNAIETARKHRWKVSIAVPDVQDEAFKFLREKEPIISFYAKSCNIPNVTFDELVVHNGQDKIVLPGKWNYKPIDIVFYDILLDTDKLPGGFKSLTHFLLKLTPNSQRFNKINTTFRFNAKLETLNGKGDVTNTYDLHECYVEKFEPSDLDYSDTNISELTLTLKYNRYTVK